MVPPQKGGLRVFVGPVVGRNLRGGTGVVPLGTVAFREGVCCIPVPGMRVALVLVPVEDVIRVGVEPASECSLWGGVSAFPLAGATREGARCIPVQ